MNEDIKKMKNELMKLEVSFKLARFKSKGNYKITICIFDVEQWVKDEENKQKRGEEKGRYNKDMEQQQFEMIINKINEKINELKVDIDNGFSKMEYKVDKNTKAIIELNKKLDNHIVEGH